MDEGLKELWSVVSALPGQVWLNALYLFVLVGMLKAVGVVPEGGAAAGSSTGQGQGHLKSTFRRGQGER